MGKKAEVCYSLIVPDVDVRDGDGGGRDCTTATCCCSVRHRPPPPPAIVAYLCKTLHNINRERKQKKILKKTSRTPKQKGKLPNKLSGVSRISSTPEYLAVFYILRSFNSKELLTLNHLPTSSMIQTFFSNQRFLE